MLLNGRGGHGSSQIHVWFDLTSLTICPGNSISLNPAQTLDSLIVRLIPRSIAEQMLSASVEGSSSEMSATLSLCTISASCSLNRLSIIWYSLTYFLLLTSRFYLVIIPLHSTDHMIGISPMHLHILL